MDRSQKEQCIASVRESLQGRSLVVVVKQRGVTVAEVSQLRRDMRQEGLFKVLKNTLLNIAIQGTEFDGLRSLLGGPTALAYSEDPVSAAKIAVKFASENEEKLEIVGGWLNGQILDASGVQTLAKLPSLTELRGRLVGLVMAPATKVFRTVREPMSRVARVIGAKNS